MLRIVWIAISKLPPARKALAIGEGPIVGALEEVLAERSSPPFRIVRHLPTPNGTEEPGLTRDDLEGIQLIIVAQLDDGGRPSCFRLPSLGVGDVGDGDRLIAAAEQRARQRA